MADGSKSVAEKLRGKHVRTLELLEQVVNERNALLERVEALERGNNNNVTAEPEVNQLNGPSLEPDPVVKELEEKLKLSANKFHVLESTLKGKLAETYRKVADKDAQLVSMKEENEKLLAHALDTSQINALKSEIRSLAAALEREKGNAEQAFAQLDELRTKHKTEIDAATLEMGERANACKALQDQVDNLSHSNVSLEKNLEDARREISTGSKERAGLRKELERLSREMLSCVDAPTQHEDLTQELGRIQAENVALNSEVGRLVNIEKELKQQLNQLKKQISSSGGKSQFAAHINLKKENQLLKMQLDDMRQINRKFVGKPSKNNVAMAPMKGGRR